MEGYKTYTETKYHIREMKISNPSGTNMWVKFSKKFGESYKITTFWIFSKKRSPRSNKEKYPEFNNNDETAYLDSYTPTTTVDLRHLDIKEGEDFSVTITVAGDPNVYHTFNCHFSKYTDVGLSIEAKPISSTYFISTEEMKTSFYKVTNDFTVVANLKELDHAKDHIRYFKAKNCGIYLTRVNVLYRLPGKSEWSKKKSSKYRKGKTVSWDCGEGEINLPNNTEVKVQLDIVGGSTKTAGESFYVRRDSPLTAYYEGTGTSLNAGFRLKSRE